jgi:hypothetical protein
MAALRYRGGVVGSALPVQLHWSCASPLDWVKGRFTRGAKLGEP